MLALESVLFWVAVVGYAVALLLVSFGLSFGKGRVASLAYPVAFGAFLGHTGTIAARWVSSGRLPYIQDYENALAGTWAIVAAYLIIAFRRKGIRPISVAVLPFVLITLGYGLTLPVEPGPVTPAYKSMWLVIHVLFAWATYAAYTSCAGLAVLQLLKTGRRLPREGGALARTPEVASLEDLTFRLVAFGFIVNGAMIASGAVWAYELWGSYWRWDPVEVWSLLTWLAYAFYLHARLTLGWRGRRLAWIAVLALFGVLMAFWGVQLAPTSYHLFRGIGELPGVDRF